MNEYELLLGLFKTENVEWWNIDIDYWVNILNKQKFMSLKSKEDLEFLISDSAIPNQEIHHNLYRTIYGAIRNENRNKSDSYPNQVIDAIIDNSFIYEGYHSRNKIDFSEKKYFEHLTVLFRAYDEAYKSLPCVNQVDGSDAMIDFQNDYTTKTKIQKWIEFVFWKNFTKLYNTVKLSCGIIQKNWQYLYNWKGLEGLFDNPQYVCEAMRNVSSDFKQLTEEGKFGTPNFMIEYKMWNPIDSSEKAYETETVNQDDW